MTARLLPVKLGHYPFLGLDDFGVSAAAAAQSRLACFCAFHTFRARERFVVVITSHAL